MKKPNVDLQAIVRKMMQEMSKEGTSEKIIMLLLKKPLLDTADIMEIFQKNRKTIRRWGDSGEIQFSTVGASRYYQWEDILAKLQLTSKS